MNNLLFNNIYLSGSLSNRQVYADWVYIYDIGETVNMLFELCDIVLLSKKVYTIKTTINFKNNKQLIGVGEQKRYNQDGYVEGSTEISLANNDITCLNLQKCYGCSIENLILINRNITSTKHGIKIENSHFIRLNNLIITSFAYGIYETGGFGSIYTNIAIGNSYIGFYCGTSTNSQTNGLILNYVSAKLCNVGFEIVDSNSIQLNYCSCEVIHWTIREDIGIGLGEPFRIRGGSGIQLNTPYVEGAKVFLYQGRLGSSENPGPYPNIIIINAYFNSHAGEEYIYDYTSVSGTFGRLSNCTIIGLWIAYSYYSGSGAASTIKGAIWLNEKNTVINVKGGAAIVYGSNNVIYGCRFDIERFNGIWVVDATTYTSTFFKNLNLQGFNNSWTTEQLEKGKEIMTSDDIGYLCYNKTLNKPVFWNGTDWTDSLSNISSVSIKGSTEERPLGVDSGFQYFDTTLKKPIWKTEDGWVDCTGASV